MNPFVVDLVSQGSVVIARAWDGSGALVGELATNPSHVEWAWVRPDQDTPGQEILRALYDALQQGGRQQKNPVSDAEILAGYGALGLEELQQPSGLPKPARAIHHIIAQHFPDGSAFSRSEIVSMTAVALRKATGRIVRESTAEIEVGKAIKALQKHRWILDTGRRTPTGAPLYSLNEEGYERAIADQVLDVEAAGERGFEGDLERFTGTATAASPDVDFDFGANVDPSFDLAAESRKARRALRASAKPRSKVVVLPHAAKKPPCPLCALLHTTSAHSRHSVDGPAQRRDLVGTVLEEIPLAKRYKSRSRR